MIRKSQKCHRRKCAGIWFLAVVLAVLSIVNPSLSASDKMTPEELVARHLESIGTAKARASVTSRIIAGNSLVIFRTPPPGQATGRAVLASEGPKSLIGMSFPSPVYPREQLGFNGNSFMAAFVTPGVRSSLGSFLMTHSLVFKQGLMGGTLSSAWPLLNLSAHNPHLEYAGIKKIDNQMLHELKYLPRGGSDLQISLFFNQETFQHVRAEYNRVIAAPTGDRGFLSARGRESRYKMVEEFSEFKQEGGLTLPHTYKIKLTVDTESGAFLAEWEITLTQFTFNERLDPNSFSIGAG
ncbi:MAG TPA: hypothetical protein VGJ48_03660 [Pyrinomonadaceae bacterium]|jgi:hypothetical protein